MDKGPTLYALHKSWLINFNGICGDAYDRLDYEAHVTDKTVRLYKLRAITLYIIIKHDYRSDMHVK